MRPLLNEKSRSYFYGAVTGLQQIKVEDPRHIHEQGKLHSIVTGDGNTVILAPEWLAVEIISKPHVPQPIVVSSPFPITDGSPHIEYDPEPVVDDKALETLQKIASKVPKR